MDNQLKIKYETEQREVLNKHCLNLIYRIKLWTMAMRRVPNSLQ